MRTQSGFALFDLLLAAAIALLLAVWGSHEIANRIDDASARQGAQWMLMVRSAVHNYLEQHHERLRHADSPGNLLPYGFHDWAKPTLAELKAAGLLDPGFPERVRPLQGAVVRILRDGPCPGEGCRVGAIVHGQQAFLKESGVVNEHMMAQWLLASEGLGGLVHPLRPDVISGQTFSLANPPDSGAALTPGTVVMAVSDDQIAGTSWLRVGDTRDPQFQSDATIGGDVIAGGEISAASYLQLGALAHWRDMCDKEGYVARDLVHGLLVCHGGVWQPASRPGGGYSMNSRYGCATAEGRPTANPVTGRCSCPPGHAEVQISEGGDSTRGITFGFLCIQ